jgi:hypothetical protein
MKPITALLKMLHPVNAGILNLRKKAFLCSNALNIRDEYIKTALTADILLESCGHQTNTFINHYPMRLLLVHLKMWITASVLTKEKVAK